MSARATTWNDRMELTVETHGGETLTLDIPSLLHDAGLLSRVTREGSVPLRVNHTTGKYVGVTAVSNGYSALSGRVASASARETAYQRAVTTGAKRTRDGAPRQRAPSPVYEPTSPTYTPTSPAYSPTSPRYATAAGCVPNEERARETKEEEKQEDGGEECEFVRERTREERDAEGRANAIPLDE